MRIKELRKEAGKTQKEVAEKLGVTSQCFGHYENGKSSPEPEMLIKIADYFLVSVDYLIGRSDDLGILTFRTEEDTLTDTEREILRLSRRLGAAGQKQLADYAAFLYTREDDDIRR